MVGSGSYVEHTEVCWGRPASRCCARPTKAQHWTRGGRKLSHLGMAHAKVVGSVLRFTSVQCCARPTEAERGRAVVGSKVKLRFLVFIGSVLGSTSFQCCAIPAEAERGRAVVLEALTAPDFRLERGSQTASDHIDDEQRSASARWSEADCGLCGLCSDSERTWKRDQLPTTRMSTEAERGRAVVGSGVNVGRILPKWLDVGKVDQLPVAPRPAEAERGRAVVMVAPDCPDFRSVCGSETASDHIDDEQKRSAVARWLEAKSSWRGPS